MQTKHLCVLILVGTKVEVGTVKLFQALVPGQCFFGEYYVICLCHSAMSVFAAFWSPGGKGLTSWLSNDVLLRFCHFRIRCPGSGVALDCIDS